MVNSFSLAIVIFQVDRDPEIQLKLNSTADGLPAAGKPQHAHEPSSFFSENTLLHFNTVRAKKTDN